jgi:hypothetical protein
MRQTVYSLAVVFALLGSTAAASAEVFVLTPENAKESGYWVRCGVRDAKSNRGAVQGAQPTEPPLVIVRFMPLQGGTLREGSPPWQTGVFENDLLAIESVTLVVRDGDKVLIRVPLRTVVDLGNYIHLLAEFSARREDLSKLQVAFEERRETGKRTMAIDLAAFAAKE